MRPILLLFMVHLQILQAHNRKYAQGYSVLFNDKSKSDGLHNIVKWTWDYGDYLQHDYYSTQIFSHAYTDTGYFSPRLIVTDSYGCSDTVTKNKLCLCISSFCIIFINGFNCMPGPLVSFKDQSLGKDLTYTWNFGDGLQSTDESPSHQYKTQEHLDHR